VNGGQFSVSHSAVARGNVFLLMVQSLPQSVFTAGVVPLGPRVTDVAIVHSEGAETGGRTAGQGCSSGMSHCYLLACSSPHPQPVGDDIPLNCR